MGKIKFLNGIQVKPNSKAPKFAQQRAQAGLMCKVAEQLGNGYYNFMWSDGEMFKGQGSHYDTVTQVTEAQFNAAKKVLLNETVETIKTVQDHDLIGKTVMLRDLDMVYLNHEELLNNFDFPAFNKGVLPQLEAMGVVVEVINDGEEDIAAVMIGENGYLISIDGLSAKAPESKLDKVVQDFIDAQNAKIEKLQEKITPELAEMSDRSLITILAQRLNAVPSPKVYKLMNHLITINPELGNEDLTQLYKRSEAILESTLK